MSNGDLITSSLFCFVFPPTGRPNYTYHTGDAAGMGSPNRESVCQASRMLRELGTRVDRTGFTLSVGCAFAEDSASGINLDGSTRQDCRWPRDRETAGEAMVENEKVLSVVWWLVCRWDISLVLGGQKGCVFFFFFLTKQRKTKKKKKCQSVSFLFQLRFFCF